MNPNAAVKAAMQRLLNRVGYMVLRTARFDAISRRALIADAVLRQTVLSSPAMEMGALISALADLQCKLIANDSDEAGPRKLPGAGLPGMLVISLPKSGTIYINSLLRQGLQVPSLPVSLGYFPRDLIDHIRLKMLGEGNCISSEHLDASAANLQMLRYYMPKWVVHIRDPRSAILSWVHHLDRCLKIYKDGLLGFCPVPDGAYFALSLRDRISWNLEHFLPSAVEWINAWLKVIDRGCDRVLLTTYDDLVRDEEAYVARILDFYAIPRERFFMPVITRSMEVSHFRVGRTDEWRDVFSRVQLERANRIIGSGLLERFGWPSA